MAPMLTSRYEKIMKTFGKRLKQARKAAGFRPAEQFSAAVALEPHTYRKYERGESEPNFEILMRICEALNIPTSHLLPLESERQCSKPAFSRASLSLAPKVAITSLWNLSMRLIKTLPKLLAWRKTVIATGRGVRHSRVYRCSRELLGC
jgi:transcriptional regulator with XRE-family HTH domain